MEKERKKGENCHGVCHGGMPECPRLLRGKINKTLAPLLASIEKAKGGFIALHTPHTHTAANPTTARSLMVIRGTR